MSELYELPDGWEWRKLPDIVQIGCKKGFSPTITEGKVPFIGMSNIDEQGGRNTEFEFEDFAKVSKGKVKFQKDAILVGKITPCTQNNKVTIVPKDINGGYATTEVYALHALEHLLPLYLNYFIRSNSINEYLVSTMIGATGRQRVPSEAIKNLDIPLPPLPEQQRIVSKLDLLFEKIDKSIALHQKNMDEANAFMGSVLNDVFGELEDKYEKKPLNKIVDNYDGKRIPIKSTDRENINGQYPYYGASGIIDYVNDYIFEGEYLLISEDGANLTVRKYPIAFIANGKFWVNNHAHIVKAKENISTNKFMEYAFACTDISGYITGSAQPKMSQGKMNLIEFALPPLQIQQKVVTYLDEISQKTEKIKQLQKEKMDSLKALKASILDSAFRGEL
ncbi:restriction endonuclease subunit S [Sulfurimonas sp.]|uniref:restriction endonuclease subunit S n=1 Tax=Sulfurimonas sp. TaxID=2022749 RepID=UPI00261589DE|nr:restriction endonuclease subunit S [Sulfurimonas sp.]MDD5157289.1 restriction endonuclease subunit S [Sulfurimonas sp.]